MDNKDLRRFFQRKHRKRTRAFNCKKGDGIIVGVTKGIFGSSFCNWIWAAFASCYLFVRHCYLFVRQLVNRLCRRSNSSIPAVDVVRAEQIYRDALDLYIVFTTCILLFGYWITWRCMTNYVRGAIPYSSFKSYFPLPVMVFFVFFAVYRLFEIWSVQAQLHLSAIYNTPHKMRAALHALLHYVEHILAFALIYFAIYLGGDSFCDKENLECQRCFGYSEAITGLGSSAVKPIYFSAVTMSTLGYGDLAPQTDLGRVVVPIQTILGLVLIVIVFTRILNASSR